jgi:hypothetical protein
LGLARFSLKSTLYFFRIPTPTNLAQRARVRDRLIKSRPESHRPP